MGDGKQYGCSRDFAASIGLVPRQYSTGGKANLQGISKRGDKNLRRLLVQGARSYMQRLSSWRGELSPQRRRIDLSKPTTRSKIKVAKTGVTYKDLLLKTRGCCFQISLDNIVFTQLNRFEAAGQTAYL
jgi:hypothetical protein